MAKKSAPKATPQPPPPPPRDPVEDVAVKVVDSYLRLDVAPLLKAEVAKAVSGLLGKTTIRSEPSIFGGGLRVSIKQSLGFGREVEGSLEISPQMYEPRFMKDLRAAIEKSSARSSDPGWVVGETIVCNLKYATDVGFSCGGRTATQALSQAKQMTDIAHIILALETYAQDLIDRRTIGDSILKELDKAKQETPAV